MCRPHIFIAYNIHFSCDSLCATHKTRMEQTHNSGDIEHTDVIMVLLFICVYPVAITHKMCQF